MDHWRGQPRDGEGRWTETGAVGSSESSPNMDSQEAVDAYSGASSFSINSKLRLGNEVAEEDKPVVEALDRLMTPLDEDVVVYRGLSGIMGGFEDVFGHAPEVGGLLEDNGFLSTTADKDTAAGFSDEYYDGDELIRDGTLFEIRAPKGTKALRMKQFYPNDEEKEIVLARGQKMRIAEVKQDGTIVLEVT